MIPSHSGHPNQPTVSSVLTSSGCPCTHEFIQFAIDESSLRQRSLGDDLEQQDRERNGHEHERQRQQRDPHPVAGHR